MARALYAQHQEVGLLAVLDTNAYLAPRNSRALPRSLVAQRFVAHLTLRVGKHVGNLAALPWRNRPAYIIERIRRIVKEIRHDPLPHSAPNVQEALWFALNRYVPQTYPGRVTVLRASTRAARSYDEESLGWAALATGGVEVYDVPGDHWSMITEPHVRVLAKTLEACIDKVSSQNGKPADGPCPE
jgi:thioesterase domain-containing protein